MEYTFLIILLISLVLPVLISVAVGRSIAKSGKSEMRRPLAEAMKRTLGGFVPKVDEAATPGDKDAPYTSEEGGMVKGAYAAEGTGAESAPADDTEGRLTSDFGSVYETKTWGSLGGFTNERVSALQSPARPAVGLDNTDIRPTVMVPTWSSLGEEMTKAQTEKAENAAPQPAPFALGDLGHAIVVREILGPPVSMRHRRS